MGAVSGGKWLEPSLREPPRDHITTWLGSAPARQCCAAGYDQAGGSGWERIGTRQPFG